MRKKLFAILMSAMMMVTFMPSMAFAADVTDDNLNGKTVIHPVTAEQCGLACSPKTTETFAGMCNHDKFIQEICACGEYKVSYAGNTECVLETVQMTPAEAEEAVADTVLSRLDELIDLTSDAQIAVVKEEAGKLVIDKNALKAYAKNAAKILLQLDPAYEANGKVGDAAKKLEKSIFEAVAQLVKAEGEKLDKEKVEEIVANAKRLVISVIEDYMHELRVNVTVVATAPFETTDKTVCYYLVTKCKNCGVVEELRAIEHQGTPVSKCATSYVCTKCNEKIHFSNSNQFVTDAVKIATQAGVLVKELSKDGANVNVATDEFRTLYNYLFNIDKASAHDISVTTEVKSCGTVYTVACSKCGESVSFVIPTTMKHTSEWVTLKAATCGENATTGLKVKKCTECGAFDLATMTVVYPKHNFVEKVVEPTCTMPGYTVQYCEGCGQTKPLSAKNFVKPLYHTDTVETVVEPTCVSAGLIKISCSTCNRFFYVSGDELDEISYHIADLGDLNQYSDLQGLIRARGFVALDDKLHTKTTYYYIGEGDVTGIPELIKNPIKLPNIAAGNGHKFTTWGVQAEPNCEHGTIWARKCSECGYVDAHAVVEKIFDNNTDWQKYDPYYDYNASTIVTGPVNHNKMNYAVQANDALGHEKATISFEETCEHSAGTLTYCTRCKKQLEDTRTAKAGKKCVPTEVWETLIDSTFTKVGTRVQKCQICGGNCRYDDISVKKLAKAYKPTLKAGKKSFKATFKNVGKAATGVQVAYKVKGANNYKYVKTTNKTSKTIKGLKSGKKYTVKVRKYVVEDGKTIYGKWCAVKYVTVK